MAAGNLSSSSDRNDDGTVLIGVHDVAIAHGHAENIDRLAEIDYLDERVTGRQSSRPNIGIADTSCRGRASSR